MWVVQEIGLNPRYREYREAEPSFLKKLKPPFQKAFHTNSSTSEKGRVCNLTYPIPKPAYLSNIKWDPFPSFQFIHLMFHNLISFALVSMRTGTILGISLWVLWVSVLILSRSAFRQLRGVERNPEWVSVWASVSEMIIYRSCKGIYYLLWSRSSPSHPLWAKLLIKCAVLSYFAAITFSPVLWVWKTPQSPFKEPEACQKWHHVGQPGRDFAPRTAFVTRHFSQSLARCLGCQKWELVPDWWPLLRCSRSPPPANSPSLSSGSCHTGSSCPGRQSLVLRWGASESRLAFCWMRGCWLATNYPPLTASFPLDASRHSALPTFVHSQELPVKRPLLCLVQRSRLALRIRDWQRQATLHHSSGCWH